MKELIKILIIIVLIQHIYVTHINIVSNRKVIESIHLLDKFSDTVDEIKRGEK